jgi:hypothetical protein
MRDSHEGRQGKNGEYRGMQTYVVEVAHDRLVRRHGEGRGGVVLGGLAVKSGEHLRTSNRSGTTTCDSSEHQQVDNRKELQLLRESPLHSRLYGPLHRQPRTADGGAMRMGDRGPCACPRSHGSAAHGYAPPLLSQPRMEARAGSQLRARP